MNCPHCKKQIPDATIARHLASKGGKATSPEKAQAVRENGKLGGYWAQARNKAKREAIEAEWKAEAAEVLKQRGKRKLGSD